MIYSDRSPALLREKMPRRGLLKSIAGLVALRGVEAEAEPAQLPGDSPGSLPEPEPSWDDAPSAIFDIPRHGHYRVSHRGSRIRVKPVPRWEVPEVVANGQPVPVEAKVLRHEGIGSTILRWWRPEDVEGREVPACALCRSCYGVVTNTSHPGPRMCLVHVPAPAGVALADEDAPLYSERADG